MRVTSISRINGVFLRLLALHSILLLSFPVSPQDTWDGPNNTEAELQTQAVSADPQSDFDLNILKIKSAELLTAQDGAPPGSPQSAPALEQNEAAITHDDIHQNQSGKDADSLVVLGGFFEPASTAEGLGQVNPSEEVEITHATDDTAMAQPASPPDSAVQVSGQEEEDRHNFALAKDGAKVVAANKEARKPESILDSDGDTFLKNECKADKWVLVELSQVAKVDLIKLSQYELYSSRVRDFEVYGRQSHPRTDGADYARHLKSSSWQLLGSFTAGNLKGTQAFPVEQPAWAKYLQLRFLTHYGNEPVCAVNDVRVYGKSAAEDLEDRLALEAASDSEEEDQEVQQELPAEAEPEETPAVEPPSKRETSISESSQSDETAEGAVDADSAVSSRAAVEADTAPEAPATPPQRDAAEAPAAAASSAGSANTEKAAAAEAEQGSEGDGNIGAASEGVAKAADPATGEGSAEGAPPVLEVLGAGLRRLIAPPGAGKKRATYKGPAGSIHDLPLPEVPGARQPAAAAAGQSSESAEKVEGTEVDQQKNVMKEAAAVVASSASEDGRELVGLQPVVIDTAVLPVATVNITGLDTAAGLPTDAEGAGISKDGKGRNGQASMKEKELLLAGNSAGSSKARHGGSVYDILVSEIKALKLQQKMVPRALSDLQKNVTSAVTSIAAELSSFHARLSELEAASEAAPSMCMAELLAEDREEGGEKGGFMNDSMRRSSTSQIVPQHDGNRPAEGFHYDVDLQSIVKELAALRTAAQRNNRREFAMIMVIAMLSALLVLSLPRFGAQSPIFRSAVLLLAVANGCVGVLLHIANALPALEKAGFPNAQGFVGI